MLKATVTVMKSKITDNLNSHNSTIVFSNPKGSISKDYNLRLRGKQRQPNSSLLIFVKYVLLSPISHKTDSIILKSV